VVIFLDYCATSERSPTVVSSPQNSLLLSRVASDADNALTSLDEDGELTIGEDLVHGTSSFPLLKLQPALGPLYWLMELELAPAPLCWQPAASTPGICTPRDWSPTCHGAISILFSVVSSFNSLNCATWSKQMGVQIVGGIMKPGDIRSGLSFVSMVSTALGSRSDPRPCSSCVVPFSSVYNHAGQARC
jgi:hypothetical protein